ncbi:translocation protein TolB [Methanosarcina lacustris Z-7289]|uniref:Translocation protein TolB n=1 Tax=Methanosarcina lacustris Z-7289 TaxID=1434111 RepID=A0A0E3S450_9EURY|nr:PD40 domain-containing protein [Methanosarcina lacustris]AKB75799.1 translocation protein TolB [Methanosarcina lacustris Z-7289]
MKINPQVICLPIIFTFLVVMALNVVVAGALEDGELTKVASDVAYGGSVWSPGGNEILFARDDGLYKISSDGSEEKKLTSGSISHYTWSPDGSKISYGQVDESGYDVWIMNADGTEKTHILGPARDLFFITYTWFPSGSKIAYVLGFDDKGTLSVINSDGSNNHEIGSDGLVNGAIAMSPDASKIAYDRWDWSPSYPTEIYIQDLNQIGNFQKLSNGSIYQQTQSWQPQIWSPDSSKIVYHSYDNEKGGISTIKADGTEKTQLTSDEANYSSPIFSPDGSKIVFVSDKTGNNDIWVMDADGNNKVQLTTDPASDSNPVWSPDGTKIAFWSDRGENNGIYVSSSNMRDF